MSLLGIILVVLIIMALGGLPTWGYHSYGYTPSGLLLVVLIILAFVAVSGRGRL